MLEEKTWQDKCFEDEKRTWITAQHVNKIQAPCGCRLSVYADDGLDSPQLDTSRCKASTELFTLKQVENARNKIIELKKIVADL